ncbi:ribosomal protein S18-alanine N-acetyltransferase [Saccharothrix violaceirubra]|uniref:[Ribosomal protein bS18]-alanine N-acetyltransferase n=1 Tax=Saccharothrix violaceirubra TaxID=413306 RepID=A0A7W7SY08_9PSEU|nr:ribosomal protein S18-alanine N-acetyltransferase [Saccharothrix violaceirubra]MBB4962948.1 ribosomal-protein-alanine N-acetyltransferase [Saccharothrix violaceirubra]
MTPVVTIAPLREEDVPECVRIEHESFPADDPWSADAFRGELRAGHHYVGAYVADELVGYAGLGLTDFESSVHTIAVDKRWQGNGIGRTLLRTLLAVADERRVPVFLEVRTDNVPAITLYVAHGFEHLGRRRRYYQPSGADAYTMGRPAKSD